MRISVKKLRRKLKLTQAKFAEKIGVTQPTVQRLEAGQKPSGPVLKLLTVLAASVK